MEGTNRRRSREERARAENSKSPTSDPYGVAKPSFERRLQTIARIVRQLEQQEPDWVEYFRETLGAEGAVTKMFPEPELMGEFEKTEVFRHIESTLSKLRLENNRKPGGEMTRVVTVRIPESLHQALQAQADEYNTSLNKLCITKLLKIVSQEEVKTSIPVNKAREERRAHRTKNPFHHEQEPFSGQEPQDPEA